MVKIKVDQDLSTDDRKINKVIKDSEKEINEFIKKLMKNK